VDVWLSARVRVEPEGETRSSTLPSFVHLPLPIHLLFFSVFVLWSCVGDQGGRRGDRDEEGRLTIISGSFQLERNLESKFLLGNSFNIDMPNSAWVGNYRFEVYCIDKGLF
jgi:hypothetical protein